MATSKEATHQRLFVCVLRETKSSTRAEVIRLHLSTRQKSKYVCLPKSEPREVVNLESAEKPNSTLKLLDKKKSTRKEDDEK